MKHKNKNIIKTISLLVAFFMILPIKVSLAETNIDTLAAEVIKLTEGKWYTISDCRVIENANTVFTWRDFLDEALLGGSWDLMVQTGKNSREQDKIGNKYILTSDKVCLEDGLFISMYRETDNSIKINKGKKLSDNIIKIAAFENPRDYNYVIKNENKMYYIETRYKEVDNDNILDTVVVATYILEQ